MGNFVDSSLKVIFELILLEYISLKLKGHIYTPVFSSLVIKKPTRKKSKYLHMRMQENSGKLKAV